MGSREKTFVLQSEEYSYGETQDFIEWYRESIWKEGTRYRIATTLVPQKSRVLDYGCGWGLFAEMLRDLRACSVDGIDIDDVSIEIAKNFVGEQDGLTFSHRSIDGIEDKSYDAVVSMQVLEHTHNPGNYLMQCNRVLKNGGQLVISVPNILNPRFFLPPLRGNQREKFQRISNEAHTSYDKTHHHLQAWDPSTFCRLLATLGFDYITHEFVEGMALPWGKYWYTKLPGLRNWSYTMIFAAQKTEFVAIADNL